MWSALQYIAPTPTVMQKDVHAPSKQLLTLMHSPLGVYNDGLLEVTTLPNSRKLTQILIQTCMFKLLVMTFMYIDIQCFCSLAYYTICH